MTSDASPLDVAIEVSGIEATRVRRLNEDDARATVAEYVAAGYNGESEGSKYVLYWTMDSFRTQHNEALELSIALANELDLPLIVLATVDLRNFTKASLRHVQFLMHGIAEFEESLLEQGIGACVRMDPVQGPPALSVVGSKEDGVTGFASRAWAIVTDRPHMRANIETVSRVAAEAGCSVIDVETHLLVPVEELSTDFIKDRAAFQDRFLSLAPDYARLLPHQDVNVTAPEELMDEADGFGLIFDFMKESDEDETWGAVDWLNNPEILVQILDMSGIRTDIPLVPKTSPSGGEKEARKLLSTFIACKLKAYARAFEVNDENNRVEYGSLLSAYLCYGFIATPEVASKVLNSGRSLQDTTAYLKNLARREMGFHLVNFVPNYERYEAMIPTELQPVLEAAASASSSAVEVPDIQYEKGETPNTEWNTFHQEMMRLGRDLKSDRQVWVQALIEMERRPDVAWERCIRLNALFMLEGVDPVSYHCIAESFVAYAERVNLHMSRQSAELLEDDGSGVMRRAAPLAPTKDAGAARRLESTLWNALKSCGVEDSRVRTVNEFGLNQEGRYVLYWAQTAFRTTHNDTLELAKALAFQSGLPLVVIDVMSLESWEIHSKRHVVFHLEGIVELEEQLTLDGISFQFRIEPKDQSGVSLLGSSDGTKGFVQDAYIVVTDRPHMLPRRRLTEKVALECGVAMLDVESKLLIPLEVMQNPVSKLEPDFSVFFERFNANIKKFAKGLPPQQLDLKPFSDVKELAGLGFKWSFEKEGAWSARMWFDGEAKLDAALSESDIDITVPVLSTSFKGGEATAKRLLTTFLSRVLYGYGKASEVHGETNRREYGSLLSPYLTHGFISPAEAAISVLRSGKGAEDRTAYLRNICKREHAFNMIYFLDDLTHLGSLISNEAYNQLKSSKKKKYAYSDIAWERGTTHDQRWNTVQHELFFKGRDILQDRRYWAQKLIEYESDPDNSYRLMSYLNDKYMIDAGDACSYYNLILCFQQAKVGNTATNNDASRVSTSDPSVIHEILNSQLQESTGVSLNKIRLINELGPRSNGGEGVNDSGVGDAQYVLYVANRACRAQENESLEVAKLLANAAKLPLIYLYVIDLHYYRRGSRRHVTFLLEGLAELKASLSDMGIKLCVRVDPSRFGEAGLGGVSVLGSEEDGVLGFASAAWCIVTDRAHLEYEQAVESRIAALCGCACIDVESRLIIPVEDAADAYVPTFDSFYAANKTEIRQYLKPLTPLTVKHQVFSDVDVELMGFRWEFMEQWQWGAREWLDNEVHFAKILGENGVDPNVSVVTGAYRGGETSARRLLSVFLQRKLQGYASKVDEETEMNRSEFGSILSPYVSYGMISARDVGYEVSRAGVSQIDIEAFLRSLLKREFAFNLVNYIPNYSQFEAVFTPEQIKELNAQKRLHLQQGQVTYSYTDAQWAAGETHDQKWNTIQHELVFRGRDLLYDRQYWAKRILQYEQDPANAYRLASELNDKFMIDALDPVSYRTIQDCFEQVLASASRVETATTDAAGEMLGIIESLLPDTGVEPERLSLLNELVHRQSVHAGGAGQYVLYWMSSAHRYSENPAFELAKAFANHAELPLLVVCVLDLNAFQNRSKRHVVFLLEGLAEVEAKMKALGCSFHLAIEPVCEDGVGSVSLLGLEDGSVAGYARHAWCIVTDVPFERQLRLVTDRVSKACGCALIGVESQTIVPLNVLLGDQIDAVEDFPDEKAFSDFFMDVYTHFVKSLSANASVLTLMVRGGVSGSADASFRYGFCMDEDGVTASWGPADWLAGSQEEGSVLDSVLEANGIDSSVSVVSGSYRGGYQGAKKLLQTFIARKLRDYHKKLHDVAVSTRSEFGSLLSPYLSQGFISPVEVLVEVLKSTAPKADLEAFSRALGMREYAYAIAYYFPDEYDSYEWLVAPDVHEALISCRDQEGKYSYSLEEWELAKTHDAKWNAIQSELRMRGRDMQHDRSLWCHLIIQYERDPRDAFRIATYLNDKYMLDADLIGLRNIKRCFEYIGAIVSGGNTAGDAFISSSSVIGEDAAGRGAKNAMMMENGLLAPPSSSSAEHNVAAVEKLLTEVCESSGVSRDFIRILNDRAPLMENHTKYVLYWVQTGHRRHNNPGLQVAIGAANALGLPLVVLVALDLSHFKLGSRRHVVFLLEGMTEMQTALNSMGVAVEIRLDPSSELLEGEKAVSLLGSTKLGVRGFVEGASLVVTDRAHLKHRYEKQAFVATQLPCSLIEVESKVMVPVEIMASQREDDFQTFFARFMEIFPAYAKVYPVTTCDVSCDVLVADTDGENSSSVIGSGSLFADLGYFYEGKKLFKVNEWIEDQAHLNNLLAKCGVDVTVSSVSGIYRGGEASGRRLLNVFVSKKLNEYSTSQEILGEKRRSEYGSLLSPYLTNGFVSAAEIVVAIKNSGAPEADVNAFLKSMARREQGFNFVRYTEGYDTFEHALPAEAQKELFRLANESKRYSYTDEQWDLGQTHDSRWNTIQHELRYRGRDIAQDRSFWCLKLIEYEKDPRNAFRLAMRLNDKYMVDALDPLSYSNIASCFTFASALNSTTSRALPDRARMESIVSHAVKSVNLHSSRVQLRNDLCVRPTSSSGGTARYVLYWATATCRAHHNESLELAKALANLAQLPLVVLYTVDLNVMKIGSKRHVVFLLEGLSEFHAQLARDGIKLCVRFDARQDFGGVLAGSVLGCAANNVKGFENYAWAIVTDTPHLRYGKLAVEHVVNEAGCAVIEVESRLIIPIKAARQHKHADEKEWLEQFPQLAREYARKPNDVPVMVAAGSELELGHLGWRWSNVESAGLNASELAPGGSARKSSLSEPSVTSSGGAEWAPKDWLHHDATLNEVLTQNGMSVDVPPVSGTYLGGEGPARKLLTAFVMRKLRGYGEELGRFGDNNRSEYGSLLSPYLCNGFISASDILLEIVRSGRSEHDINSYLRNLGRREMAFHFVVDNPEGYDVYEAAIPEETRRTLSEMAKHRTPRYAYTFEQWEKGETHDKRWNSVQHELIFRGRDIAQDRFFWLYKIIEYESDPRNAYYLAMTLNDKYMVDALDAVGYRNVSEGFVQMCEMEAVLIRETQNKTDSSAFKETILSCLKPTLVEESRVRLVNQEGSNDKGKFVLYHCSLAPRTQHNESFEIAKSLANEAGLPLVYLYVLDFEQFKSGSWRHLVFYLQGLAQLQSDLTKAGVRFELRVEPSGSAPGLSVLGDKKEGIKGFAEDAWAIVTDRAYLRRARDVEARVAREARCAVVEVESCLLVPLEVSAGIMEDVVDAFFYRFFPVLNSYVKPISDLECKVGADVLKQSVKLRDYGMMPKELSMLASPVDLADGSALPELSAFVDGGQHEAVMKQVAEQNGLDVTVPPASGHYGGELRAREHLDAFVMKNLPGYGSTMEAADPSLRLEYGSLLSPFFSTGFLSVVHVAVEVLHSKASDADIIAFFRNLCRRELAYCFVYQTQGYDSYQGAVAPMVRETLEQAAANRPQKYIYTDEEWELGETHDMVWNEIQQELLSHGREFMADRVYWCEKLIQYESRPSDAYRLAVYLNDKYMIDALDPVGYKNISECFNLACLTSGELGKTFERNPIRTILKNALDSCGIDKTRVRVLNDFGARAKVRKGKGNSVGGEYVLYVSHCAFRKHHNDAFEVAKALANMSSLPLVFLALVNLNHFQRGSYRQINFVMKGLAELEKDLRDEGVIFCMRFEETSESPTSLNLIGSELEGIQGFEARAWAVVTDRAHLRANGEMVKKTAFETGCAMIEVESILSVPLEKACSGPAPDFDSFYERFLPLCRRYAKPLVEQAVKVPGALADVDVTGKGKVYPFMKGSAWSAQEWLDNESTLLEVLAKNRVDVSIGPPAGTQSGEHAARVKLEEFLKHKLKDYAKHSQEFGESNRADYGSNLSPYLCFGIIAASEIMVRVFEIANNVVPVSDNSHAGILTPSQEDISVFLQNLARRELAYNFAHFCEKYDTYENTLSQVVRKTLEDAGKKRKNYDYSLHQWEVGETHDDKWNEVQKKLRETGRNVSHDRSFWCQKIIEYSRDPSKAFQVALSLNERIMIDALDAVCYKNIVESFKLASMLVAPQTAIVTRPQLQGTHGAVEKTTMKTLVKTALEDCGVERSRVRLLNDLGPRRSVNDNNGSSEYVLYWMTSALRVRHNESLEVAKVLANNAGLPLVVLAVLDLSSFALYSKTHVLYYLQGLVDVERQLKEQNICFVLRVDPSEQVGGGMGASVVGLENTNITGFASRAWAVVTDRSHLRVARASVKRVASHAGCCVIEVESRLVVPLEVVGNHAIGSGSNNATSNVRNRFDGFAQKFFAALGGFVKRLDSTSMVIKAQNRKLRPEILGYQWDFMRDSSSTNLNSTAAILQWGPEAWLQNTEVLDLVLSDSGVDLTFSEHPDAGPGGEMMALRTLEQFAASKFDGFASAASSSSPAGTVHQLNGNKSALDPLRAMFASLQTQVAFGFISMADVVHRISESFASDEDLRAVLWKVSRLEYAVNYVYYNSSYEDFAAVLDENQRAMLEYLKNDLVQSGADPMLPLDAVVDAQTPDQDWNELQNNMIDHARLAPGRLSAWMWGMFRFLPAPHDAFEFARMFLQRFTLEHFGPFAHTAVVDAFVRMQDSVDISVLQRARQQQQQQQASLGGPRGMVGTYGGAGGVGVMGLGGRGTAGGFAPYAGAPGPVGGMHGARTGFAPHAQVSPYEPQGFDGYDQQQHHQQALYGDGYVHEPQYGGMSNLARRYIGNGGYGGGVAAGPGPYYGNGGAGMYGQRPIGTRAPGPMGTSKPAFGQPRARPVLTTARYGY
ncbi:Deoxyribodipyrimidine photo-lyase [Porphyridium purpureum]|uniref:Deoxyribodipyrimidine photo-lyase n=1 Tax=Porphyridium purpureum TaxID=35688 RepID=A0A5J4YTM5_PORPP|nr:Deoxyribodipyrimidine photo-lyase [Porphyridium purpureum]|eukprot:POR1883..scf227_4